MCKKIRIFRRFEKDKTLETWKPDENIKLTPYQASFNFHVEFFASTSFNINRFKLKPIGNSKTLVLLEIITVALKKLFLK